MGILTVAFLISTAIGLFVVERMMGIFYEKRETSLPVMLRLYFIVFALLSIEHFFHIQNPVMYRVVTETAVTLAGYFIITLNYKSSLVKRFVVMVSTFLIFIAISAFTSVILFFFYSFDDLYSEEALIFMSLLHIAIMPVAYLIATILRRFKYARIGKTNEIHSP